MSDLQLAILLQQITQRLTAAMDDITNALPQDIAETRVSPFTGRTNSWFPCLNNLEEVIADLGKAAETLQGGQKP